MSKKARKGISAPLGVIFGVLLAIILVILAVFIAFNISTSAVKSQSAQINVVGTPAAFYNESTLKLTQLSIKVYNPSDKTITVSSVVVQGHEITLSSQVTVSPKQTASISLNATQVGNIALSWDDVYRGYIDVVIVTDTGTVSTSAQLIGVK